MGFTRPHHQDDLFIRKTVSRERLSNPMEWGLVALFGVFLFLLINSFVTGFNFLSTKWTVVKSSATLKPLYCYLKYSIYLRFYLIEINVMLKCLHGG